MKNRRVFALNIIILLIINFICVTFFLPVHTNNCTTGKNNSVESNTNLLITNSKNINDVYSNFKSDFAPLRIVTFVGGENTNYDKNFAYLAAIPIGLYKENNILKVSPILFDNFNFASENFLIDWKNYCNKFDTWDGIKNIIYIGDVSPETKNKAEDLLNPEAIVNPDMTDPIHIVGNNIYEIASNIATYFWYRSETAVIAVVNETFLKSQSTILTYSNTLGDIAEKSKLGVIKGNNLEDFWSKSNLTLNTGGIYVEINNTNNLVMELFGNFSQLVPWMYDTNQFSKTNWVFFPNVSYPANFINWGLHIHNRTTIISPINYNLNFYNLTYQRYQIQIDNSESCMEIALNWTDSNADLKFWVLNPSGQLVDASSRNLIESGQTNKSTSIIYPEIGTWTVIVTRRTSGAQIPYRLTVNITKFSSYRRQCIESAANGAVIASLMNKPLLYVTNASIPNATKQALTTLNVSRIIRVDPFNLISSNVVTSLLALNVTYVENLTSRTKLYEYIFNITHESDIVLSSINEGFFAPASLLAAFHGAPLVFTLNSSYNIHAGALKNYAIENWIGFQNPGDSALLNQSIPRFQDMKGLANIFYNWMNSLELDKPNNETILVVSPITELNPFFDRAINGKALVGRFIGSDSNDLAVFICKNILYPALSYSNLSFRFESQTKAVSCNGNSTLTGMKLYASTFSRNCTACQFNDNVYHSYYNSSNGRIVMAYYVNLSDSQIFYNNISQVEISIDGKIGYSNNQIKVAGWGIWNWTSKSYKLINPTLFNSTGDQSGKIIINYLNKSHLIYSSNSRIELFILVNTTGPPISVSIDFVQFNVTYYQILNNPAMLSSSITYWHNFNFQGNSYNYSSAIPLNFTQAGYQVINATGYREIYSQLTDNCKFWYYSGNVTLNESVSNWNMLFTNNNYWRSFGDYDDKKGATPNNPDADGDHVVTANGTLGKWQSGLEFNRSLVYLPSTFILLQAGCLGYSDIPEYLIKRGATSIVANLKQNTVGYSEHFAYIVSNELLAQNSIGNAVFTGLNQTSHIYSQNRRGNIIEIDHFSNFTEESQAFVLYGDPELSLISTTFDLPCPTSYRPLIHGFYNTTYRKVGAEIWANITDLDSNLRTEVFAKFNITGTYHNNNPLIRPSQYNRSAVLATSPLDEYYNFKGDTNFDSPSLTGTREPLGYKTVNWRIYDSDNEIQLSVPIYLLNNPANIILTLLGQAFSKTQINDTGVYHNIDHKTDAFDLDIYETIGRIKESIFVSFFVDDTDNNISQAENVELNVTLILKNINDNFTLSFPMNYQPDGNLWDEFSNWTYTYHFGAFNTTGTYFIYCLIKDYDNTIAVPKTGYDIEIKQNTFYQYFYLINWVPEPKGANFLTTNGTGPLHRVFRVNETLQVFASVSDMDGNNTHVKNVMLCMRKDPNQWINITMSDDDFDNNWTSTNIFSAFNKTGLWYPYIRVTDKDNLQKLFKSKTNFTVANIPPQPKANSLTIKNLTQIVISSVLRNTTIQLYANATDLDIAYRSTLKLYACLKDPAGKIRYQNIMTYDNKTNQWIYNFTPKTTDTLGNWTYYVSVWDEVNVYANSSQRLNLTFVNNIPVIKSVKIYPTNLILNVGEPLRITGNVSDVENLGRIQVFIEDEKKSRINQSLNLNGVSKSFYIEFTEEKYSSLEIGNWTITIKLFDADGNFTNNFSFDSQQNNITILVRESEDDENPPFPYQILIIIAIVVTAVLATLLVYRTRKKEAAAIPAARIKQIIKKISKEKEEELAETRAEIKARIKPAEVIAKPLVTPMPTVPVKQELTEEEKEKLNLQLQDLIKDAQSFLEKELYDQSAMAYHDAAKVASKLEKYEMARIYSDKGEEVLQKKSEMKKLKKKSTEKKKRRRAEEILSKVEIENIKAEIGEIMKNARRALREGDALLASKYYREVASLYRKIFNEEQARIYEAKANEIQ